jgi:enoyl-CoA hydratase/carnithine racemase
VGQWMARLAGGPPLAQRMSKELLDNSHTMPFEAALVAEANAQSVAFAGKEAKEGIRAFMAKRDPMFPDA